MVQLRPYQQRAISELREHYRDRPLLCLPTGAGKTSVAAEIIRATVAKGNRAIFLVHRRELVDQAVERLEQFGVYAGRIIAGYPESRTMPAQVASIPTLVRREHWPADLVIVDECSHAVSASWMSCLARYAGSWIIGLTATPIRLDGRGLGDMFGCIVEPVSTQELVDQGHLIEPVVYAPPVDLKGVRVRRGDYDLPQLAEHMNKLTGSITETWLERAPGLRTVVFAVNIDHSQRVVEAFLDLGVRAEHIDGGTATQARADTLARLRSGETTMVSNCMVLSEGWDLPDLQCALLARPTKSLALFRQMVGRVMRPPGPVVVLDHAGNHHEHGSVLEPIAWSLDAREKRDATHEPVRSCPECFAVIPPAATACPECGFELPAPEAADEPGIENEGELVRIPRHSKRERYREMVSLAMSRGYKLGWARGRYRNIFGAWPRFKDVEKELYSCFLHLWETKTFGARVVERCARCYATRSERYV